MDFEDLYKTSIKMVMDKFNIPNYSREDFSIVYKSLYNQNQPNSYEMNKEVLKKIIHKYQNPNPIKTDIDTRVKELENLRNNIDKLSNIQSSSSILQSSIEKEEQSISQIQITNEDKQMTFKTFIINTIKNNFKITPSIDIKMNSIFPCCLCLPMNIKNQTPYVILSINDGMKNNNYTYIPVIYNKWDIWKPITKNYDEISLNTNKWMISIYNHLNKLIEFEEYSTIYNVIYDKTEDLYSLKIDNINLFEKNDRIKLILKDGTTQDNKIVDRRDDKIFINPEKLEYKDFIDARLFNYNQQFSLLFKYYSK